MNSGKAYPTAKDEKEKEQRRFELYSNLKLWGLRTEYDFKRDPPGRQAGRHVMSPNPIRVFLMGRK